MEWYLTYLFIYIIKTLGGTISNYRLILMSEDNKLGAFITNLFSTLTWIFAASLVFTGIKEDPFIAIPFVLGVVSGNYIGVFLDKRIKAGKVLTTVITDSNNKALVKTIQDNEFNVSSLEAEGKDGLKNVLLISSSRKKQNKLLEIIGREHCSFSIGEKAEKIT